METSKRLRWDGLAVPLAWLAELDNCPAPDALADAFGDRYLCRHNPMFAKVRQSAIELGYRFSAEDTPMWRDYQAFGLTTLHQILSTGIIPYHDTGNTVRRLLESNPRSALSPRFILGNFKRNHAFHESAHCVACSVMRRMDPALRLVAPSARGRFVLESIFAESFANTVEAIGSLVRTNPLSDTLFYSLNSYMAPKQGRTSQLDEASAKGGEYLRFALLFLSYFEANLNASEPDDMRRERIGLAAGCEASCAETIRAVAEEGSRLSGGFRENTTPMYFELLGYKNEYDALTQAAWLSGPDNRQFIRDLVPALFDTAISSSSASPAVVQPLATGNICT